MATHESLLIRHAVAVLRGYAEQRNADQPGPDVQLALRVLIAYVPRHLHYCDGFWRIAQNPPGLPKRGNLLKTLELIERYAMAHLAASGSAD